MATLFGSINKGAVAPEMMEMGDKFDQQLNDPQNFYKSPDENLLLNTNRAFDMADRGQIARSEVPTVGYLNSNMKDTNTRKKATGMDIMNRRRFATSQNKVEVLTPENFMKLMKKPKVEATEGITPNANAGITPTVPTEVAPTEPTAGDLSNQLENEAKTFTQPTRGVTPEMQATMNQPNASTFANNEMMANNNISAGLGGRELGQGEQEYTDLEAEYMAKAIGWNKKDSTITEKRVLKNGDTQERTISEKPYAQAGYDENMGISTPRIGMNTVTSEWKTIKKAKKPTPKAGTTIAKVFKKVSKSNTFKDNIVDEMAKNQKFINYTTGASEATKQSVKDYSRLSAHKMALEGLDDEAKAEYIYNNDLGSTSYTDIVSQVDNYQKQLLASGIDITNEMGANMFNESAEQTENLYETTRPIGMAEDIEITYSKGGRTDIGYDKMKRVIPVGSDKKGNEYYKFTMLDNDTGKLEKKSIAVKDFTADMETQFLETFGRSGGQYYGTYGTGSVNTEASTDTNQASYLGDNKQKVAYDKAMVKKNVFDAKMESMTDIDKARDLYETYENEMKEELKDYPDMMKTFSVGAYPISDMEGGIKKRTDKEKAQLFGNLDKKFAKQKGFGKKQAEIVNKKPGAIKSIKIGSLGGKSSDVNYQLKATDNGVSITLVTTNGRTIPLKTLVPLNFTSDEDINTFAGQEILKFIQSKDPSAKDSKVLDNKKVTYLGKR